MLHHLVTKARCEIILSLNETECVGNVECYIVFVSEERLNVKSPLLC